MNWEIKRRSLGLIQEQQFTFSQRWIWNPDEFYDSMILFFHQLKNEWWKTAFHRYDRWSPGSSPRGCRAQSPATHHIWDGTDWMQQDGRANSFLQLLPVSMGAGAIGKKKKRSECKREKEIPSVLSWPGI